MRTGNAPEPALGSHWAGKELDLENPGDRAAARAEFLRRLPEADFLPPASWPLALALLQGRKLPDHPTPAQAEALHGQERGLRHELDQFTERFFQIDVSRRRRQWQALVARCHDHPVLAGWLDHLEAGLEVRVEDLPEEPAHVAVLTRQMAVSFVLRPAERAKQRRDFLSTLSKPMKFWQAAARELSRDYPDLAALDPVLVEILSTWDKTRTAARNGQLAWGDRYQQTRGTALSSQGADLSFLRWGLVLLIGVVSFIFRAATSNSSRSDGSRYQLPVVPTSYFNQPYVPPVLQPGGPGQAQNPTRPGEAIRRLLGEEADRLLEEHQRKQRVRPRDSSENPGGELSEKQSQPGFSPPVSRRPQPNPPQRSGMDLPGSRRP